MDALARVGLNRYLPAISHLFYMNGIMNWIPRFVGDCLIYCSDIRISKGNLDNYEESVHDFDISITSIK